MKNAYCYNLVNVDVTAVQKAELNPGYFYNDLTALFCDQRININVNGYTYTQWQDSAAFL